MNLPYQNAAELALSVQTLLTLPDVYLRVKEVVEDPASSLSDLVNAIALDPGITARLLKLVNSAYYNLDSPVDNVRQAVNLLGMKPVHDLVLATSLTGTFGNTANISDEMLDCWQFSLRCAVYSRLMARHVGLPHHERLFVDGLLSEIGHLIMTMQMYAQMLATAELSGQSAIPLHQAEIELLGFHYAEVGGELMKIWRMPDSISLVVQHQLNPQQADPFEIDAAIVHLASIMARMNQGDITANSLPQIVDDDIWTLTGLSPQELPAIHVQAMAEIDAATSLFLGEEEAA